MSRVSKEQIKEWVDNPVTVALKWLCTKELNNTRDITVADCIYRGEPQKTQERLIEQANKEDEWLVFLDLLQGRFKWYLGDLANYDKLVEDYDEDESE